MTENDRINQMSNDAGNGYGKPEHREPVEYIGTLQDADTGKPVKVYADNNRLLTI